MLLKINLITEFTMIFAKPMSALGEAKGVKQQILYQSTKPEVLEAVKSLKNSPCTDVFELNSRIIKETIVIIIPLLLNACFSNGVFPDCFKLAKVILIGPFPLLQFLVKSLNNIKKKIV